MFNRKQKSSRQTKELFFLAHLTAWAADGCCRSTKTNKHDHVFVTSLILWINDKMCLKLCQFMNGWYGCHVSQAELIGSSSVPQFVRHVFGLGLIPHASLLCRYQKPWRLGISAESQVGRSTSTGHDLFARTPVKGVYKWIPTTTTSCIFEFGEMWIVMSVWTCVNHQKI